MTKDVQRSSFVSILPHCKRYDFIQTIEYQNEPCLKVSTTKNFKISIKNQTFIVLGGLKCEKLANNVIKVTNKGLTTCYSKKSEQIRPYSVKICVFKPFFRANFGRSDIFWPAKPTKKVQNMVKKAQKVVKNVKKWQTVLASVFVKKSNENGPFLVKKVPLKKFLNLSNPIFCLHLHFRFFFFLLHTN